MTIAKVTIQLEVTSDIISAVTCRLAQIRIALGISQKALAAIIGTSQSFVSEIEGGKKSPTPALLRRYADAVGVELSVTMTVSQATATLVEKSKS